MISNFASHLPPAHPQQGGYDFGFLHVKAVDDTGHDRLVGLKVRYLEVVDAMVGQLLRLLWRAEAAGAGRYSLVVTGDHSTPVEYGDHSHEPVPLAIAHLRHVVSGGQGRHGAACAVTEPLGGEQRSAGGCGGGAAAADRL